MITKLGVGLSIILASSLLSSHIAYADIKSDTPEPAIYKSDFDRYKEELFVYRQSLKQYEDSRRAINTAFKIAIERALSDAKEPNKSSLTQIQKRQNAALMRNAVAMAVSIRDAAISALGDIPIPPEEPTKSMPNSKSRKESRKPSR